VLTDERDGPGATWSARPRFADGTPWTAFPVVELSYGLWYGRNDRWMAMLTSVVGSE